MKEEEPLPPLPTDYLMRVALVSRQRQREMCEEYGVGSKSYAILSKLNKEACLAIEGVEDSMALIRKNMSLIESLTGVVE